MAGLIIRFPVDIPDPEVLATVMILNDEFVITNIANNESLTIQLSNPPVRMKPVPVNKTGLMTSVSYTAQSMCDKEAFKIFYLDHLGKSIKMSFEGYTYYGYLTNVVIGYEDVTFDFTHVAKILQPPEDPFWSPQL